jgi:hypothetical protein
MPAPASTKSSGQAERKKYCASAPEVIREQAQPECDYDESDDDDAERVRAALEITRVFDLHDVHSSLKWRRWLVSPGRTLRGPRAQQKALPANRGWLPVKVQARAPCSAKAEEDPGR